MCIKGGNRDEKTDHLDDDTQQAREGFGEFWKTPQFLEYPKVPITEFNCLSTIQDRFPSIILNVSKISAKTALSLRENSIEYILNSLEVTNVDAIILMTGLMYSVEALGARERTNLFRLSKNRANESAWSFSETASYPIVTS
ncbi:unnamed protein product, partial [Brenthis ino]